MSISITREEWLAAFLNNLLYMTDNGTIVWTKRRQTFVTTSVVGRHVTAHPDGRVVIITDGVIETVTSSHLYNEIEKEF